VLLGGVQHVPFRFFFFHPTEPLFFFLGRAVGFHVAISYIKEGIETDVKIVRGGTKGVAMVEVAYVPIPDVWLAVCWCLP